MKNIFSLLSLLVTTSCADYALKPAAQYNPATDAILVYHGEYAEELHGAQAKVYTQLTAGRTNGKGFMFLGCGHADLLKCEKLAPEFAVTAGEYYVMTYKFQPQAEYDWEQGDCGKTAFTLKPGHKYVLPNLRPRATAIMTRDEHFWNYLMTESGSHYSSIVGMVNPESSRFMLNDVTQIEFDTQYPAGVKPGYELLQPYPLEPEKHKNCVAQGAPKNLWRK